MRRPLIITLIAVASCFVTLFLFLVTAFSYLSILRHAPSATGVHAAATGRVALTIATAFFSCVVIGLFRFSRWAVISAGIGAGICANYAISTLLVKNQSSAFAWILLFVSVWLAWQLLWKVAPKADLASKPGERPLGLRFIVCVAATSLLLSPTVLRSDFSLHAAGWQVASHIFNFAFCAALSLGLWNLREWARLLTEITSFLAPLNVLPSLLGTNKHKPFVITLVISILMYAAWSVWYLRQDGIVEIFDAGERL